MRLQREISRVFLRRYQHQHANLRQDAVVVEEPLEIRLQFTLADIRAEKTIAITMRTPGQDIELAAGFLLSEGIIHDHRDIQRFDYCVGPKQDQHYNVLTLTLHEHVTFDPEQFMRYFYTASSCGVCGKSSIEALRTHASYPIPTDTPKLSIDTLYSLPEQLRAQQTLFDKTGGLHAAAIFHADASLCSFAEDIGRHNAVDKAIGTLLLAKKLPLFEHILFVSGRVSFEIVQKAVCAGIPCIAALGAPSTLAIDLADAFHLTLVGFLKPDHLNLYTGESRLLA